MSLYGHPLGQQSQQPSQQPTQQPTHFPQTTPAGASIPMSANQFELLTAAYNATLSNQHIRADGEDYEPVAILVNAGLLQLCDRAMGAFGKEGIAIQVRISDAGCDVLQKRRIAGPYVPPIGV